MPLIRIREKNQITLPRDVVEFLGATAPGHVQYTILNDGVLIRAMPQSQEDKLAKIRRLAQSVKSAHVSAQDVDATIDAQRNAWDR
jgi:hypothetical protein